MLFTIELFLLLSVIVIIFIQILTLRIVKSEHSTKIIIDYSFLSLVLTCDKDEKRKKRKNGRKKLGKKDFLLAVRRPFLLTLAFSRLTLNKLTFPTSDANPAKRAIIAGSIFATVAPLLTFFDKSDIPFDISFPQGTEAPTFDLTLECRLYNAVYVAVIFFFEIVKRRLKKKA